MSKLVGDRIYSLRKKLGLSQEEFANRIGVSRQVVSKWEMNQVVPLTDKLKKISEEFNVSYEEIFNDKIVVNNNDNNFFEAMKFAKKILENMISKTKLHEIDILKVKKYYEDAIDKRIIVLDEPLFYKDYLPFTDAIYVVYPSSRGGYAAQGVTIDSNTNKLKKDFPLEWVNNLPPYLRFCHTSRFLIASDTFEGIMHAVREALK